MTNQQKKNSLFLTVCQPSYISLCLPQTSLKNCQTRKSASVSLSESNTSLSNHKCNLKFVMILKRNKTLYRSKKIKSTEIYKLVELFKTLFLMFSKNHAF
uniref:(northern house mosquito) hypothetical protein n=1 Tax=Culex pipiens TaxID=7175 RepID=A0A8D8IWZ6_CULPI